MFGRRRSELNKGELTGEAQEILSSVGLSDYCRVLPDRLSGGMRQRASVARAIFRRCQLTILDEPFGALDLITREALYSLVQQTSVTYEMAYLLVTHLPEDAFRACTRSIVLNRQGSGLDEFRHADFSVFDEYRAEVYRALRVGLGENGV